MFRISEIAPDDSSVTLRLEGRLVGDWVAVFRAECERVLAAGRRLRLDCCEVTYADPPGVEVLRSIQARAGVEVVRCPPLIERLLAPGGAGRP